MQVARQIAHWQIAVRSFHDLENFAATSAWQALELQLGIGLRRYLTNLVDDLDDRAESLRAELDRARTTAELDQLRRKVVVFRRRYLRCEVALDLFGTAVSARTSPRLAAILAACDLMAERGMSLSLVQLGKAVPRALCWPDSGLGAAVLRQGLRLADGGSLSPCTTIKLTRQNLARPSAVTHEIGHEVAAQIGWNEELRAVFAAELSRAPEDVSSAWASWVGEITADTYQFVLTGYGGVATLHDVVSGGASVLRVIEGEVHPVPYLRVALGVSMSRSFGEGPWDALWEALVATYPLEQADPRSRSLIERSVEFVPRIAELCLHRRLRAFGGKAITDLIDPAAVSPESLSRLEAEAGPALKTSPHWLGKECLRLLALSTFRAATEPQRADEIAQDLETWMVRLGENLEDIAA